MEFRSDGVYYIDGESGPYKFGCEARSGFANANNNFIPSLAVKMEESEGFGDITPRKRLTRFEPILKKSSLVPNPQPLVFSFRLDFNDRGMRLLIVEAGHRRLLHVVSYSSVVFIRAQFIFKPSGAARAHAPRIGCRIRNLRPITRFRVGHYETRVVSQCKPVRPRLQSRLVRQSVVENSKSK